MQSELRNYAGNSEDLIDLFKPFTKLNSPTTVPLILDKYLETVTNEERRDNIEAYQTLIRNGEVDSFDALNNITEGALQYAIEYGFIKRGHDRHLSVTDVTLTQFYLTTKGWQSLEDEGHVTLHRWDNTIEVEPEGSDFLASPTGKSSHTVNTLSLPRHLDLGVLWEDGMMTVEPSPRTALVHLRGNTAYFVGVEPTTDEESNT